MQGKDLDDVRFRRVRPLCRARRLGRRILDTLLRPGDGGRCVIDGCRASRRDDIRRCRLHRSYCMRIGRRSARTRRRGNPRRQCVGVCGRRAQFLGKREDHPPDGGHLAPRVDGLRLRGNSRRRGPLDLGVDFAALCDARGQGDEPDCRIGRHKRGHDICAGGILRPHCPGWRVNRRLPDHAGLPDRRVKEMPLSRRHCRSDRDDVGLRRRRRGLDC